MFRRRVLCSVLTLGMFVGACDMTSLYLGASDSFAFDPLELGKISARFTELPDPPDGVMDPPGKAE
jgi:hypothetical protein